MAQDLSSIIKTGHYCFEMKQDTSQWQMFLEYEPITVQFSTPSEMATESTERFGKVRLEKWSGEQIDDFVRKLGFLDKEKEEGRERIIAFLHFNQARDFYSSS